MAKRWLFEAREEHRKVPDSVLDQAIHWAMLMRSGMADDKEREACRCWRAMHADHELAWQRLEGVCGDVKQSTSGTPTPLAHRVLAGSARASSRRKAVKLMLSSAAAGGLAWGVLLRTDWRVASLTADYRTHVGEREQMALPDGSRLVLNTDSAVDIDFVNGKRMLQLRRGEIMVETAPGPHDSPLLVHVDDAVAQPLGTRFVVRRFDAAHMRVAVREGAVELRHAALPDRRVVSAGEQGEIGPSGWGGIRVMDDACDSWVAGTLVVERMALGSFINELGRYRSGVLRCDPRVAALQVSGAFPLDNTDTVLAALVAILPVSVKRVTPYWVTVAPA